MESDYNLTGIILFLLIKGLGHAAHLNIFAQQKYQMIKQRFLKLMKLTNFYEHYKKMMIESDFVITKQEQLQLQTNGAC